MSLASDVHEYSKQMIQKRIDYDIVKARVLEERRFDIAYSESYSMHDARRAVQSGYPVLVFMKAGPQLIIGESEKSLLLKGVMKSAFYSDTKLNDSWTGKAIVFMDHGEEPVPVPSPEDDAVIFRPELDTWKVGHEMKEDTKAKLRRMSLLPSNLLPETPVVVIFKEPSSKDLQCKNRGYQAGATAYILDPVDPLTVVLHEIGHFYYKRLTDFERKRFDELRKELGNKPPVIFDSKWSMKNGEELFCTLYLWYLKSKLVHPGYRKILGVEYAPGLEALEEVFRRVDNSEDELKIWKENERRVSMYLDRLIGKAVKMKAGGRILKAKELPVAKKPGVVSIPRTVCRHIRETKANDFVEVTEGLLKGQKFALKKDGSIDYNYMQKHSTSMLRKRKTGG